MRAPPANAEPIFESSPQHVGLDREHDHDADDDRLQERVDVQQVHPVSNHADHQRSDECVQHRAPATEEARSPDDDCGDRVELGQVPGRGRPGVEAPGRHDRRDPSEEAAQHVDRDEHGTHRDPCATSGLRVATDRVDPPPPHEARADHRCRERDPDDEERGIREPADRSAADRPHDGRHASQGLAAGQAQREASGNAQGCQRDDERVGQAPPHEESSIDQTDGRARREHDQDHQPTRGAVLVRQCPHHRGQREIRPDGEIDATGDDHEQLADRQDGDHGCLRQDVAGVLCREEDRREKRHRDDQTAEDQDRAEPEHCKGAARGAGSAGRSHRTGRPGHQGTAPHRRQPRQPDRPSSCVPDRPRRSSNLSPRPLPRTIDVA